MGLMDEKEPFLGSSKNEDNSQDKEYKRLKSLILSGGCRTKDLRAALKTDKVTQEQFSKLSIELAEKFEKEIGVDQLTKVFNRAFLAPQLDSLKQNLNYKEVGEQMQVQAVMVIFLDLKKFKVLNDTYGHAVGDKALQLVAKRLKENTKFYDMVCRVGGDEFLVALPIYDKKQTPQSLEAIFKRIQNKLHENLSVNVDGKDISFEISMGYEVLHKGDDTTAEELLNKADKKMYEAKNGSQE